MGNMNFIHAVLTLVPAAETEFYTKAETAHY